MAKESAAEAKAVSEKAMTAKGTPNKKELSVASELPEDMKKPKAPGDSNAMMAGDGGMKRAREHLEHQTERGKHSPTVGGHKVTSHSGGYDGCE